MRSFLAFTFFITAIFLSPFAHALYTEVGVSYTYKKTSFSKDDVLDSQSLTGSLSFYIWERIALELSYTDGLAVRKERPPGNYPVREITQYSTIYGSDLIFGFADKKDTFQPYIKGGIAYISKKQVVQDKGYQSWEIKPKAAYAPSYGIGVRIMVSENFSLKASYDGWQTPVDDGVSTTDAAGRLGFSWLF
ncbi:MAG: outer membrane protein [Pseudobdellovibrionaceae bacterium]